MKYPILKSYEEQIIEWTDKVVELSIEYAKERTAYGNTKSKLDILLAGKILSFVDKKKNCGYEMGLQLLMATTLNDEPKVLYQSMIQHDNRYKALEMMIKAYESKIMSTQSIMRYNRENDGGV